MHGCYCRFAAYFKNYKLVHEEIEIKRVRCKSCNSTHAVLPIDIIAYRLLSLFVILFVLFSFHIKETPVLKIADRVGHSFQFVYSALCSFEKYINKIHHFFRQVSSVTVPLTACPVPLLKLIREYNPIIMFQYDYISKNKKPCFMCKYFDGMKGPPIGRIPL